MRMPQLAGEGHPQRTRDELDRGASHVGYELTMLADVSLLPMPPGPVEPGEETSANANLEAMLLHARCMIEFLVGRPTQEGQRTWKPHDIAPADYAPAWTPPDTDRARPGRADGGRASATPTVNAYPGR